MTRLTKEREAEDVIRDHLNNPDMFGILSHTQGMALLKVIDALRAENAKLQEFYDTHVSERLNEPNADKRIIDPYGYGVVKQLRAEIDALRAENDADKCLIAELENKLWLGVEREEKLKERIEKLRISLGQIKTMTDDCQGMSRYVASVFDKHVDKALAADDELARGVK